MLVFLLLVVTSTLCYYLGAIALFMALVSLLWKALLIVALPLTAWIVWKRYVRTRYRRLP